MNFCTLIFPQCPTYMREFESLDSDLAMHICRIGRLFGMYWLSSSVISVILALCDSDPALLKLWSLNKKVQDPIVYSCLCFLNFFHCFFCCSVSFLAYLLCFILSLLLKGALQMYLLGHMSSFTPLPLIYTLH